MPAAAMQKILNITVIVISISFICFASQGLCADTDTSLRTDLNFNYTINEKFRSVNYIFLQADKDMSNYDYVELGTGLRYQTSLNWLSFLVWYQQGYAKDENRSWLLEQKPSINVNTVVTLLRFRVSNQIRYEYRMTPDWNDYRIKNTLEIARPDVCLQPHAGWELFYENHDRNVMLNRFKFGIIKAVGRHVSLGPYYRLDYSRVNHQWKLTRQLFGFQVTVNY